MAQTPFAIWTPKESTAPKSGATAVSRSSYCDELAYASHVMTEGAGEKSYVDMAPPPKIAETWASEKNWFLKALELADAFTLGALRNDLAAPPICLSPNLPDFQSRPESAIPPPPESLGMLGKENGGEESLIVAVEREGFNAIPDWYGALDRIYGIKDMGYFHAKPEKFVGDAKRAGSPGYSYLIAKHGNKQHATTPAEEEAKIKADEALLERYQNRLLVTSLPYRTTWDSQSCER